MPANVRFLMVGCERLSEYYRNDRRMSGWEERGRGFGLDGGKLDVYESNALTFATIFLVCGTVSGDRIPSADRSIPSSLRHGLGNQRQ